MCTIHCHYPDYLVVGLAGQHGTGDRGRAPIYLFISGWATQRLRLYSNVVKTKCRDPADRLLGAAMPGLEATAALPLMYGRMPVAWLGHAAITFSTPGASIGITSTSLSHVMNFTGGVLYGAHGKQILKHQRDHGV